MKKRYDKELSVEELVALSDKDIDYSDISALDSQFWDKATIKTPNNKQRITVRFDADMITWFKSQGRGYQTKMNAVLRSFYESQKRH